MEYHSKWSNRRVASGGFKPFIFLMIEVAVLAMACWFVSLFDVLGVTILVSLGAIFLFVTSSLSRYRKVQKRQKYYKNKNIKHKLL